MHTIGRQSQPDFVFVVFERLNMGATQLNEQELRNCIYQGVYTDLLQDLAGDARLLRVCRAKAPHLRMKDRELVLRFFAMSASCFHPNSDARRARTVKRRPGLRRRTLRASGTTIFFILS